MEFLWIFFAFAAGFAVKLIALPPMVGYLAAGFMLNYAGVQPTANLDTLADLGITLMLFTIGLKLNVRDLIRREVWAGSLSHMLLWIAMGIGILLSLGALALPIFSSLDLRAAAMLAFALSFSSTVCVVKLLEESGEIKTRHGRLAVMVLVMQDIVAVGFLAVATGKPPSIFALALPLLLLTRPLLDRLLSRVGHDELLPLTGFCLAFGGYQLFEAVGIKGDLGALVLGMLISRHPKGAEISKALLNFKDLFLVGFFLSIGFVTLPTVPIIISALVLTLLLPLKLGLFFMLFTRLHLRGRTAWLAALVLGNFSEFGLIVIAFCVDNNWLPAEWLVVLAIALSLSFVATSVIYRYAHSLYSSVKHQINRFERDRRLPEDVFTQPSAAEIIVVGMGRVGRGAYDALHGVVGEKVWGMDADRLRVAKQLDEGMNVFVGDGEDADFWENFDLSKIRMIMLALPAIEDSRNISNQLKKANYPGRLAAIARYADERDALIASGIDNVFNFYREAGIGFAEETLHILEPKLANQHSFGTADEAEPLPSNQ